MVDGADKRDFAEVLAPSLGAFAPRMVSGVVMSRTPSEGTRPERRVRRALLQLRVRGFELNARDLPGSPDIVLRTAKKAIFVNGCFWHLHPGCPKAWVPGSTSAKPYWAEKFIGNALRDQRVEAELKRQGWQVLVVWECEVSDERALRARLRGFLASRTQLLRAS